MANVMFWTRRTRLKKSAVVLLSLVIVVLVAEPAYARHRFSGGIYIGVAPYWWGSPYLSPYLSPYPYWWGPPAYGYIPPPVVLEPPPVYIERPPPVPSPSPPPPVAYWYYCGSARSYYPSVETCPEPWVKVPARPQ